MDSLWRDIRFGVRFLRSKPGFTAVATVVLALGIGANTAVFSAVNALLLRPLPVRARTGFVFGMALREGYDPFGTSLLEYDLLRTGSDLVRRQRRRTPRLLTLLGLRARTAAGSSRDRQLPGDAGVEPALGRLFTAEEEPARRAGHRTSWPRSLATPLRGRPGRDRPRLELRRGPTRCRWGPSPRASTCHIQPKPGCRCRRGGPLCRSTSAPRPPTSTVARLALGVSLARADAELKRLARRLEQDYPQLRRGWSFGIVPLRRQLMADLEGRTQRSLLALVVSAACLLLICCANVASLLLARGIAREGEMAIRASLGAGPAPWCDSSSRRAFSLGSWAAASAWRSPFPVRPLLAP